MLGVVNKAIEAFVCQRYGGKLWADLLIDLSLSGYEFEAMLTYEDGITYDLIDRLAKRQSKMHQDVLEDIALMSQKFSMVALGAHDTSDSALALVEQHFTGELLPVRAGRPIHFNGSDSQKQEAL